MFTEFTERYISKAELARRAKVSKAAVTKMCSGNLADATSSRGVDTEHPLVVEWLNKHNVKKPSATKPEGSAVTPELEDMTIKEVVMKYGSVDGFKRYVDALKSIAEYKQRDMRVQIQRGTLVDRDLASKMVFVLLDAAFQRLVSDVPESTGQQVIARVESGGMETLSDVTKIIREANSKALQNAKEAVARKKFLNDHFT